jgi:hypothetical protein
MDTQVAQAAQDIVAARGAAWLDRYAPGWERTDFQMANATACLLYHNAEAITGARQLWYAQVIRHLRDHREEFAIPTDPDHPWHNLHNWAQDHGFNYPGDDDWPGLQRAWERLVQARLSDPKFPRLPEMESAGFVV